MSPAMRSMQEWLYRPRDVDLRFHANVRPLLALWLVGCTSGSRHVLGHHDPSKCCALLIPQHAASHPRTYKQLWSSLLRENYEQWNIKVKELLGNVCYVAHTDRNAAYGYAYSAGRFSFRLRFWESEQEREKHSGKLSDSVCTDPPAPTTTIRTRTDKQRTFFAPIGADSRNRSRNLNMPPLPTGADYWNWSWTLNLLALYKCPITW
jgi:hypothetical protein